MEVQWIMSYFFKINKSVSKMFATNFCANELKYYVSCRTLVKNDGDYIKKVF